MLSSTSDHSFRLDCSWRCDHGICSLILDSLTCDLERISSESRSTKEGSRRCSQSSVRTFVLLSRYGTFQSFLHLLSPSSLSLSYSFLFLPFLHPTPRSNVVDEEDPSRKLITGARNWGKEYYGQG